MNELRNFMAHLKQHGVSRNNRFRVTIPLPAKVDQMLNPSSDENSISDAIKEGFRIVSVLNGDGIEARRGLQVMCAATELPGTNIDTIDVKQGGPTFKIASGISKSDIEFSFLLSSDCFEKNTLDLWKRSIFDDNTQKASYYDDYRVDIQIEIINVEGKPVYSINLEDAYPVLFSPIALNKQAIDETMEYRATFTYAKVAEFTESNGILTGTTTEEIIENFQNGDYLRNVDIAREQTLNIAKGNYTGMALEMHGMIEETAKELTGLPSQQAKGVLSNFIPSIQDSPDISSGDKTSLTSMVKKLF